MPDERRPDEAGPEDRAERGDDAAKAEPGHRPERVEPDDGSDAERGRADRLEGHTSPPQGGGATRDPG